MFYRTFIFIAILYICLLFNVLIFQSVNSSIKRRTTLSVSKDTLFSLEPREESETNETRRKDTEICGLHRHKEINCSRVIEHDMDYISNIRTIKEVPERRDCRLEHLVRDCPRFLSAHGYNQIPVTMEEKLFPLAFAIKMHRSPNQVEVLLRNIYRRHNVYCIYVDKKSPDAVFNTITNIAKCLDNIIVIEERENVVYSSSAHVRSEISCMKAVSGSPVKWRYYINMAGQEFPLRTNFEMVKILKSIDGLNDIETFNHPVFLDWRVNHRYAVAGNSLADIGEKKKFKYNIDLSKGSAYGLFTKQFVDFILTDDVAQQFINWLNDTYSPEENVWATLNTLPWAPGGYFVEVRHMLHTFMSRATIWSSDVQNCHGSYVRSVCVYGLGDVQWLTRTPEFIANKFDQEDNDPAVLDCMEEWYRSKAFHPKETTTKWDYYTNLPHVMYYMSIRRADRGKRKRDALKLKDDWLKEH